MLNIFNSPVYNVYVWNLFYPTCTFNELFDLLSILQKIFDILYNCFAIVYIFVDNLSHYHDVVFWGHNLYRILIFFFVESVILFLISQILYDIINNDKERRILVFFIYFELIHLLLATLLLVGALVDPLSRGMFITTALLIIGASGAETALFLALFIRFFKLTGSITFLNFRFKRKK